MFNSTVYSNTICNSPVPYVLFDDSYLIKGYNKAFAELMNVSDHNLIDSDITGYIYYQDINKFNNPINDMIHETMDSSSTNIRIYHKETYIKAVCSIMNTDDVKLIGCNLINITEEIESINRLYYMSFHDKLTGVYNRRFFDEELTRLDVERNLPLSIVMADVNGLKLVNDSFGHSAGDELLVKATNVITQVLRKDDIVARIGGDEFLILLPKTDKNTSISIVERIKEKMEGEHVMNVPLSVSFGVNTKTSMNEDIDDIYKSTEDIMYQRKLFESQSMRSRAIKTITSAFYKINPEEERHSISVATLCERMAVALGYQEIRTKAIHTLGLIHDIGKIGLSSEVLKSRNGNLSNKEWEEVKRHPEIGYHIVGSVHQMAELANMILCHHERIDGNGYPKGIKGDEIPEEARILSICDAYDSMITYSKHKITYGEEYAINEIIQNSGTQFDSHLARVFVEDVLKRDWRIIS